MTDQRPILYSFRRCPFAMRARMAIAVSRQVCALREVVLRNKPPEMIDASPKGTVPVLVLPGGQVIEESLEIMHWALRINDPEDWLIPLQNDSAGISELILENDKSFKDDLDRYKYSNRYEDVDPLHHRARGVAFLTKLDDRLKGAAYLFGDSVTFADAAIAPFVRQFVNHDRDWFATLPLSNLQRWLTTILGSDLFLSVMHKHPPWSAGMPEPLFPANH